MNDAIITSTSKHRAISGRQLWQQEARARYRWIQNTNPTSTTVAMAKRHARRKPKFVKKVAYGKTTIEKVPFKPVYFYMGIPAPDHKEYIRALCTIDPDIALAWQSKLSLGRALAAFGQSVKEFVCPSEQ